MSPSWSQQAAGHSGPGPGGQRARALPVSSPWPVLAVTHPNQANQLRTPATVNEWFGAPLQGPVPTLRPWTLDTALPTPSLNSMTWLPGFEPQLQPWLPTPLSHGLSAWAPVLLPRRAGRSGHHLALCLASHHLAPAFTRRRQRRQEGHSVALRPVTGLDCAADRAGGSKCQLPSARSSAAASRPQTGRPVFLIKANSAAPACSPRPPVWAHCSATAGRHPGPGLAPPRPLQCCLVEWPGSASPCRRTLHRSSSGQEALPLQENKAKASLGKGGGNWTPHQFLIN